ncbi:hypothetical protein ACTMU2_37980 [Cupriavidus basilensis]
MPPPKSATPPCVLAPAARCPRASATGWPAAAPGEVKIRESVLDLDGGAQVCADRPCPRHRRATSVNGRPAAVDPYALVPQFYPRQ